jgi:hypothetical protein
MRKAQHLPAGKRFGDSKIDNDLSSFVGLQMRVKECSLIEILADFDAEKSSVGLSPAGSGAGCFAGGTSLSSITSLSSWTATFIIMGCSLNSVRPPALKSISPE